MAAVHDLRGRRTAHLPAAVKAGLVLIVAVAIGFIVVTFEQFGASTESRGAASTQAAPRASQDAPEFDYFPDHYRNQPMEQAEPVPTF